MRRILIEIKDAKSAAQITMEPFDEDRKTASQLENMVAYTIAELMQMLLVNLPGCIGVGQAKDMEGAIRKATTMSDIFEAGQDARK